MRIALANGAFSFRLLAAVTALAFAFTVGGADAADAKSQKSSQKQTQSSKSKSSASSKSASKSSKAKTARAQDDEDDDTPTTGAGWRSGTAALIVDANTGKVLYEENADTQLHPASVTKVMTLYMLFEQLEAGRLRLDSQLPVSARAAAQSPSKLNVRAGSTIEVDDAIKALVTRSANDVAVVIAEAIGGDESTFGEMMTRKARQIGMTRSQFRNASGLPNPGQLTTARDLATLGIAIQDRFPQYYKYFSTRTFVYKGESIGNHNRLLGRVEGVDGIKTGYTRASGFNLLTSVHKDDRFIIGVVLGGSSGPSRDARMASLIANNYNRAYAGARTSRTIQTAANDNPPPIPTTRPAAMAAVEPGPIAPLPAPQRLAYAADPVVTAAIPARATAQPANELIKPVAVRTTAIQRPTTQTLTAPGFSNSGTQAYAQPVPAPAPAPAQQALVPSQRFQTGQAQVQAVSHLQPPARLPAGLAEEEIAPPALIWGAPVSSAEAARPEPQPVRTASAAPVALPTARTSNPAAANGGPPKPGWQIQIGAFNGEKEAKARLDAALSKARTALNGAAPYTEKVSRGSSDLYRARFAGLSEKSAKDACRLLQRNDFDCMTIRN
ncbi:serine hydrolase [Aquabacter sp. P-9]|uniref:serine hydrolase n=1 Tax=Aquabacter sediminis TaxID=3029197 RepID=UPI00237DFC08|nr:serine hydrolase [Aquabacter sp. P-9]MDE1567217.1 serine hydrolase [Aquabacter sp. P-9]